MSAMPVNSKPDPINIAFEKDFNKIQLAAARLVAIQEMAKRKGSFSEADNKVYADSLNELGQAAQGLAKLQQTGQIKDFSILLQPEIMMPEKSPFGTIDESNMSKVEQPQNEDATEQQFNGDDLLPPNPEDPYEDVNDSVAVAVPKKDASVAEAKPIGLSIAGEGGVASSKPNAIALSGRNGLAVASPKATAIAGVSPEDAAAFSVSLPSRNQLVIKNTQYTTKHRDGLDRVTYDDYDYSYGDLTPVRTVTRYVPPLHHTRMATGQLRNGGSTSTLSTADVVTSPDFISKWKVAIAEDGTAPISEYRSATKPDEQKVMLAKNKLALRSADGQTYYFF